MNIKLLSAAILLATSGSLFATETYDPSKSYSAKEQVQFNDSIFEAQWWVNLQQILLKMHGNPRGYLFQNQNQTLSLKKYYPHLLNLK